MLLVFGGANYYPSGGWSDFLGTAGNLDEAKTLLKEKGYTGYGTWYQVVSGMEVISSGCIEDE